MTDRLIFLFRRKLEKFDALVICYTANSKHCSINFDLVDVPYFYLTIEIIWSGELPEILHFHMEAGHVSILSCELTAGALTVLLCVWIRRILSVTVSKHL